MYVGSVQDLLFIAIESLGPEQLSQFPDMGSTDTTRHRANVWETLGHPKIAALLNEWQDLADEIKIRVEYSGTEDAHPVVANEVVISGKVDDIRQRLDVLSAELSHTPDDIVDIICERFRLKLKPFKEYQAYWIERIIAAPGFALFSPEGSSGSWSLTNEPYG